MRNEGSFLLDIIGLPGAGKTTLPLSLIDKLRDTHSIGAVEANIESNVDSLKERAIILNPNLNVFVVSARTGVGIEKLARWLSRKIDSKRV